MIPSSDRTEVADLHVHEKYTNIADVHVRGDVLIHEDADCHIHSALIEGALTLDAKQMWKAPSPDKPLMADGITSPSTARMKYERLRMMVRNLGIMAEDGNPHLSRAVLNLCEAEGFTKEESR